MIFATVGTHKQPFNRMVDYIIKCNLKDVVIQNGYTECDNENIKCVGFISKEEMNKYIEEASYVITHAGITVLELLEKNKKVIVMPREKKYGENLNNLQFEICDELGKAGYFLVAKNYDEFLDCVNKINKFKPKKYKNNTKQFLKNLEDIIDEYLK